MAKGNAASERFGSVFLRTSLHETPCSPPSGGRLDYRLRKRGAGAEDGEAAGGGRWLSGGERGGWLRGLHRPGRSVPGRGNPGPGQWLSRADRLQGWRGGGEGRAA